MLKKQCSYLNEIKTTEANILRRNITNVSLFFAEQLRTTKINKNPMKSKKL